MRFGLLGTLEVVDDAGNSVDLGGSQPRTVLAMLLAASGQLVPADSLVDVIWGDDPPDSALGTVQSYISRLRRTLEPDRAPRDAPRVLLFEPPGYRLQVDPTQVDLRRFERLAEQGRTELQAGDLEAARATLLEADALWRGPALLEFLDHEFARGIAARLEERRMAALDDRIEAELRLGRHTVVVGELAELVRAHPLREPLRGHLALALYRSGRQSDALRALDDARRVLRDELGIEPGRALRELEHRILEHDPTLDLGGDGGARSPSAAPSASSARATPPVVTDAALRIVGRQSELAQLRAALAEAKLGARVALVEGEPGIGKTSLVEAFGAEATADGAAVVWGRCHEGDAAPALWPWVGALRSLAEASTVVDGSELEQLLSPTSAGRATSRFELFDAIAQHVRRAAAAEALVIVLDDLQWADLTSLELLTFLADRLSDDRVLIIGTVRELDVGRNDELVATLAALTRRAGSRRIELRGLDTADTNLMLERATGLDVDPAVAAAIHDRAEGNPFYATELARLLVDDAGLDDLSAVMATTVPVGVRDVVRSRLARLPADTNDLLQVGAVIGRDIDLGILTRATERSLDTCLDDLEPAVVQRLLVLDEARPSVLRFSHALVREVLVDGIPSLRRARLHLRVADALAEADGGADDTAEILAEHLWAAASVGAGQRAAGALERAADVAVRRFALASAEDMLQRAVHLRHSAGSSREAMEAEMVAVARLNAVTRARTGFLSSADSYRRGQELARQLGRRDVLHEMMWVEWGASDTACDFGCGRPLAQYFKELGETSDDPFERLLGQSVWGIQCWHDGRMTEACASLDAAAAVASWRSGMHAMQFESEQRMFASGFALHVHDLVGDRDDDIDAAFEELARRQPDRFSVSMIYTQAVSSAIARGHWERAERYGRLGVDADPDVVFTFWGSGLQMSLGDALMHLDQHEEGWAYFTSGRDRYLALGTRTALGHYFANAGLGLLRAGRVDEAAAVIADARREHTSYHEHWPLPEIFLAEGELAFARGNRDAAASLLAEGEAVATTQGSHGIARRIARRRAELALNA
jgi:DNA-binding SARP family transcriptional activator